MVSLSHNELIFLHNLPCGIMCQVCLFAQSYILKYNSHPDSKYPQINIDQTLIALDRYIHYVWRPNGRDSVSNHQPHHCLLNRLFRRRSKKTSKLRVTGLCVGNSLGPVNSLHKGQVTRKMFPFDDVIMNQCQSEGLSYLSSCSYRDDVKEIVITQCVKYLFNCSFCYFHSLARHTTTRVKKNHNILGRGSSLDIPEIMRKYINIA